jgi:cobalt-zinc-cadmium efflux system outer membrane protein
VPAPPPSGAVADLSLRHRETMATVKLFKHHPGLAAGIMTVLLATARAQSQTPAPAMPDTLRITLADARAAALGANPALAAARLDTTVARGELRQSALFFTTNPSFEVLGTSGGNGLEAGVAQEVELFGQQGARASAGRAGMARARAAVSDATRLTIGDVDRTFYQLYSASRRGRLADDVFELTRRIADVAQRQLAAGEISRLEFNLASVELGRTRARALAARREREEAAIELARLLGLPTPTPVIPVLDGAEHVAPEDTATTAAEPRALTAGRLSPAEVSQPRLDADSLIALALARRPDLAEREAAIRQADALATTAGREALPNLVARAVTEPRDDGTGGRVVRPGVGITLPLFNRNRGRIQALRASARKAELERESVAQNIRAQVRAAAAAFEAASTEVRVLEATVLTPARQNRRLVEIAYREGKVGLPELLLIRNQAIDAELEYWTAWLAERQALASLAQTTGTHLSAERVQP